MTGRGVDQILARPSDPVLYEPHVYSALTYVELAEHANGPIPRPVNPPYIWGDALAEMEARAPDARIINLETSVTTSSDPAPKGINYRMHPDNIPCLLAAGIDCCVLANNHVMDWGVAGLLETLGILDVSKIATVGAGRTQRQARTPAVLELAGDRRILVFGFGSPSSGIPLSWCAGPARAGVAVLTDLSRQTARQVARQLSRRRQAGDVVVASIHWGGNWGYAIPRAQREFAHHLIDSGAADVVHGHSSHHVKGIEVHGGKLILYGCGDFIDDYEGITGYPEYRSDLAVAYFVQVDSSSGELTRLEMVPFRHSRMRLESAPAPDVEWLRGVLNREGRELGTHSQRTAAGALELRW